MSEATLKALFVQLLTLSDENLNKAKEFVETFVKSILPTTMTIAGRTYEILGFLQGDEKYVIGYTMVKRAKKKRVNLGQKDCKFILDHQKEIPVALRGKIIFVFPNFRHPVYSGRVACVYWREGRWVQFWHWLGNYWYGNRRVLRRK